MDAIDCGAIVVSPAGRRTDRHVLAGTVLAEGVASGQRRVALFLRWPLTLVAVTRSKRDGSFRFSGLPEYPERSLKIVAYDDDQPAVYNAEVADHLTQVAEG